AWASPPDIIIVIGRVAISCGTGVRTGSIRVRTGTDNNPRPIPIVPWTMAAMKVMTSATTSVAGSTGTRGPERGRSAGHGDHRPWPLEPAPLELDPFDSWVFPSASTVQVPYERMRAAKSPSPCLALAAAT